MCLCVCRLSLQGQVTCWAQQLSLGREKGEFGKEGAFPIKAYNLVFLSYVCVWAIKTITQKFWKIKLGGNMNLPVHTETVTFLLARGCDRLLKTSSERTGPLNTQDVWGQGTPGVMLCITPQTPLIGSQYAEIRESFRLCLSCRTGRSNTDRQAGQATGLPQSGWRVNDTFSWGSLLPWHA